MKSFAAGRALRLAALSPAGAHDARDVPKAADPHAAHMSMPAAPAQMNLLPPFAQYANAEPMPERLRAALDAGWRGDMPRTVWIGRDGAREARSGLLTADVLDGWLPRAKR
ncbi:signal peptide protein [Burkholderia stabilis]|nr:signal peptide protein [Burkholderia stabilis]